MGKPKTIKTDQYLGYPIWAGDEYGACRDDILRRGVAMLEHMREKHDKVRFARFDTHFPLNAKFPDSNKILSEFTEKLAEYYASRKIDAISLWVREQVPSNSNGHYHFVLLLDGNKVQNVVYGHLPVIAGLWAKALGFPYPQPGLVDYCNHENYGGFRENGFLIRRDDKEAFAEAVRWLSYLAKAEKGTSPKGVRAFGSSRLTNNNGGIG